MKQNLQSLKQQNRTLTESLNQYKQGIEPHLIAIDGSEVQPTISQPVYPLEESALVAICENLPPVFQPQFLLDVRISPFGTYSFQRRTKSM